MSSAEIVVLQRVFESIDALVEYGCGGSTKLAITCGVKHLWSVETDPLWIKKLAQDSQVSAAISDKRLNLLHGDIGAVGKWGHPVAPFAVEKIHDYPLHPWRVVNQPINLVLIDGRFRAACLAASLLHTQPSCLIALHDVSPSRPSYLEALKLLDVREQVDTLVIGTRRPDLTTELIQAALAKFSLIPA